MLKKAGIVVATAAAGLLAVSPLAFAGDKDDHDHGRDHDGHKKVKVEDVNHYDDSNKASGKGLINVTDNNVAINNCTQTNRDDDFISIIDDVAGVLNILSKVETNESNVNVCDQEADVDDSVEQRIDH